MQLECAFFFVAFKAHRVGTDPGMYSLVTLHNIRFSFTRRTILATIIMDVSPFHEFFARFRMKIRLFFALDTKLAFTFQKEGTCFGRFCHNTLLS